MIPRDIHVVVLPQTRGENGYEWLIKRLGSRSPAAKELGQMREFRHSKKAVGKVYNLFALSRGNGVPYFCDAAQMESITNDALDVERG